jgi:hypothetical protein
MAVFDSIALTLYSCCAPSYAEESRQRCVQLVGQYKPPEASPASPAVDAKPKIPPETVEAFNHWASSCGCNRQPFKNPTYEVAEHSTAVDSDGRTGPPRRYNTTIEGGLQAVCFDLMGNFCKAKNVKCDSQDKFTDDTGKVIAVANPCAVRIDYL